MSAPAPSPRYRPSTDRPERLDLGARWLDVVRIARSHPRWRECVRAGWDPEDLLQELLVRLLGRQATASAYDPQRAGVGKYLFVATASILGQLLAKRGTAKERLTSTGVSVRGEAGTVEVDASVVAVAGRGSSPDQRRRWRRAWCCREGEAYPQYRAAIRARESARIRTWRQTVSRSPSVAPQSPAKGRNVPQRAAQRVTTWRAVASVLGLSEDTLHRRRQRHGDLTPTPPWFADEQAVVAWYEGMRSHG